MHIDDIDIDKVPMDLDIVLEDNTKEMVMVGRKVDSEHKEKEKKSMSIFSVQKVWLSQYHMLESV